MPTIDSFARFSGDLTMQAIKEQITLIANESDAARQQAMSTLQDLLFSFETTEDTIHRYGHMVS